MLVECCYRLIPKGEVIHTKLDPDKREIFGMPDGFMNIKDIYLPIYNTVNYMGKDGDLAPMCEAVLLSRDEFAVVIEDNAIGFFALEWNGFLRFLETPTDMLERGHDSYIPHPNLFKEIGYRVTRMTQYRSSSGIYRMTASEDGSKVYTDDGVLTPLFDVNQLSEISYNYKGYKDCVANGHYGVVYYGDEYRFVDITPNKELILV